ncbi:hypothetical protein CVT24_005440 [Panaeolus cyanescens]|uniref:Uncharacterized protein n=1 Tax=Panaeolus cyanescens TaxID=181874 RepID=A0A409WGH4_9AGAR|nr:hypothetical protein CVT24_005440 [Panaeolus cyanescens]
MYKRNQTSKKTVDIEEGSPKEGPLTSDDLLSTRAQPSVSTQIPGSFASSMIQPKRPGVHLEETILPPDTSRVLPPPSISMRFSPTNPFQTKIPRNDEAIPRFDLDEEVRPMNTSNTPRVSVPTRKHTTAKEQDTLGSDRFARSKLQSELWDDEEIDSEGKGKEVDRESEEKKEVSLTTNRTERRDKKEVYVAAVDRLEPVSVPVEGIADVFKPERFYYVFPSCVLEHECRGGPEGYQPFKDRYTAALTLAEKYTQRTLNYGEGVQYFTRSDRIYLKRIFEIISSLFSNLYRAHNGQVYGYKLDHEIYADLTPELLKLRKENEEGCVAWGFAPPRLPKWGRDGDLQTTFWTANDFEVLAAGYRAEVEAYLQTLLLAHKKVHGSESSVSSGKSVAVPAEGEEHRPQEERTRDIVLPGSALHSFERKSSAPRRELISQEEQAPVRDSSGPTGQLTKASEDARLPRASASRGHQSRHQHSTNIGFTDDTDPNTGGKRRFSF